MAGYGRHGDAAFENLGSRVEGQLMDKKTWPCLYPGCTDRADPDVSNYCGPAHEKRALSLNTPTYAQRAEANLKLGKAWTDKAKATGLITDLNAKLRF